MLLKHESNVVDVFGWFVSGVLLYLPSSEGIHVDKVDYDSHHNGHEKERMHFNEICPLISFISLEDGYIHGKDIKKNNPPCYSLCLLINYRWINVSQKCLDWNDYTLPKERKGKKTSPTYSIFCVSQIAAINI